MIRYNFDRVFKARGIDKPFAFLCKAGFPDNLASKIKNNKVLSMQTKTMEKLCLILHCTPGDFFEWIPDKSTLVDQSHPLNKIRKSEKEVNLTQTLNLIPIGQLAEIEQMIKDKINL